MANVLFPLGRQGFLDGSIDWDTNDIRVMLVRSTYTYDSADQYVSDLGAVDNGRSAALGSKTVTNGVADAADTTITATSAVACNALVVFQHTGSDATARLIGYIDTPASGLPFTPGVSQVVPITWDNGTNRIFTL
jgi:hypothetical protein